MTRHLEEINVAQKRRARWRLIVLVALATIAFRLTMGASFVERNIEYVRFIRYLSAPADSEGIENYFKSIDDYRAIGVLEAKRNQYQNASQSFSLALDREPSDFLSRYFFAEVMFKLGYFERAITEWKLINAASYVERFISDAKLDETEAPYRLYLADTAVRELAPSSPECI